MTPDAIALACVVGPAEWDGLEATLASLVLTSPSFDGRIVIFSRELTAARARRLGALHPRLELRDIGPLAATRAWLADPDEEHGLPLAVFTVRGVERLAVLRPGTLLDGDLADAIGSASSGQAVARADGLVVLPASVLSAETERELADSAAAGTTATSVPARLLMPVAARTTVDAPEPSSAGPVPALPVAWTVPALWRRYLDTHGATGVLGAFYEQSLRALPEVTAEESLDLPATASRRYSAGDFAAAAAIWRVLARTEPELTAEHWLAFGSALKATSRYDEAAAALTIAAEEPRVRASALAVLSQVRWITHRLDEAGDLAEAALRWDPFERTARSVRWRVANPVDGERPTADTGGTRIGHVAFYVDPGGNFGDVLLPIAVRRSIETTVPDVRWHGIHAHQLFDVAQARIANETLDALVVGGGGLFLPDTMPNGNSGWQWNVSDAALEELRIPLVIYTVGYNLFPGQQFLGDRFEQSLSRLVGRAGYVGLRNSGSIDRVRTTLTADLAGKVEYLPCATTVFGTLPTGAATSTAGGDEGVLINAAYDRSERRFGGVYGGFLASMADWVRHVQARDRIRVVAHAKEDERFAYDLRREHGLAVDVVPMHSMDWRDAVDVYRRAKLVVGMRGHASMIPFGLGTPIVSLISHPKMAYFLDDISHPEWGVRVDDDRLTERLMAVTDDILDNEAAVRGAVDVASQRLKLILDNANARIADAIAGKVST